MSNNAHKKLLENTLSVKKNSQRPLNQPWKHRKGKQKLQNASYSTKCDPDLNPKLTLKLNKRVYIILQIQCRLPTLIFLSGIETSTSKVAAVSVPPLLSTLTSSFILKLRSKPWLMLMDFYPFAIKRAWCVKIIFPGKNNTVDQSTIFHFSSYSYVL